MKEPDYTFHSCAVVAAFQGRDLKNTDTGGGGGVVMARYFLKAAIFFCFPLSDKKRKVLLTYSSKKFLYMLYHV